MRFKLNPNWSNLGPKCFNKSEESDADRDCTECQEIDDCSVCCSTSSTDSDCHCVTNKTIYDYGSGAVTPRPKQIAKRVPPSGIIHNI